MLSKPKEIYISQKNNFKFMCVSNSQHLTFNIELRRLDLFR